MASAVQTDLQAFGGGRNNSSGSSGSSSTINLVRLLRKAEEGRGLEIDYSDALSEALGQGNDHGADATRAMTQHQRGVRSSSLLRGRVPSFGKKRYVYFAFGNLLSTARLHERIPAREDLSSLSANVVVRRFSYFP